MLLAGVGSAVGVSVEGGSAADDGTFSSCTWSVKSVSYKSG